MLHKQGETATPHRRMFSLTNICVQKGVCDSDHDVMRLLKRVFAIATLMDAYIKCSDRDVVDAVRLSQLDAAAKISDNAVTRGLFHSIRTYWNMLKFVFIVLATKE